MSEEFTTHIARDGECWDAIAYKYYGNAFLYPTIIEANPAFNQKSALDAGDVLQIPVLAEKENTDLTSDGDVPPWQR